MENIYSVIQKEGDETLILPEDLRQTDTTQSSNNKSYRASTVHQIVTKKKLLRKDLKQKHKQEMYGLFIKRMTSCSTTVPNVHHKFK